MRLSKNSLDILSNFTTLSNCVAFYQGKFQRMYSNSKHVYVEAFLEEEFPQEFGIYDLSQFISVNSLFSSPELAFNGDHVLISETAEGFNHVVKYMSCDKRLIMNAIAEDKEINGPTDAELVDQFTLKADTLTKILKAASVLTASHIRFVATDGKIKVTTFKPQDDQSSSAEFPVADSDKTYELVINIEYLKCMMHDYTVRIGKNGLVRLESQNMKINYMFKADSSSKL